MINLREITIEEAAIESAWADEMPLWWRALDKSVSLRTRGPKSRIGVFEDDRMVTIYTLQEVAPKTIDAHLSCVRGVNSKVLIESAKVIKQKLIDEGFTVFLWPLRQNFGLIRIAKLCGFSPTGVRLLNGNLGDRPAEWVQLGVTK